MKFKNIFLVIVLLIIPKINYAQLQIPDLSPRAEIKQTIGYTEITISYSRPSLRGRNLLGNDGILPYQEFWRTGANTATKISFSHDITFDGNKISKGDYTILTIPDKKEWTINLYTYSEGNWTSYIDQKPYLSIKKNISIKNDSQETFEFGFKNIKMDKTTLTLEWEKVAIAIPIEVNTKEIALKKIERSLSGPSDFDYFLAGLYLHETKTDLPLALVYVQKATKNENALFFQVYREALILRDLKRNTEALESAKRSLKLSKKINNNDFIRLNNRLIEELSKHNRLNSNKSQ